MQFMFFVMGAFMGLVQPLAAGGIAVLMIILGWKSLLTMK